MGRTSRSRSGLWVFVASVAALIGLEVGRSGRVTAFGVGTGPSYAHRTPFLAWDATVAETLVEPGERVRAGDIMLRLHARRVEEALRDAREELARVQREANEVERSVTTSGEAPHDAPEPDPRGDAQLERLEALRERLTDPEALATLRRMSAALVGARATLQRLEEAHVRHDQRALIDGVVVRIAGEGERLAPGASAAHVSAERAREVTAFLAPTGFPENELAFDARAAVIASDARCEGRLVRGVAPVRAVAPQLERVSGLTHGWPVRLALPEDCAIGLGQVVEVSLRTR